MTGPEFSHAYEERQMVQPADMREPLKEWQKKSLGGDPRIRYFAEALDSQIRFNPLMDEVLRSMINVRLLSGRRTSPQYTCYLVRDAAQYLLSESPSYRELSLSAEGWGECFDHLLTNERPLFENLLDHQEVMTVVPDRAKGIQLYLALQPADAFPDPITILDVGAGDGAGLAGLLTNNINHRVTTHLPSVVPDPENPHRHIPSKQTIEHKPVTEFVNKALAKPLVFGECIATDITEPRNPFLQKWRLSCLRPSEFLDDEGGVRSQLEFLHGLQVPNLKLEQLDFSDDNQVEHFWKRHYYRRFDLVTMVTVLNQLNEPERTRALANACRLGRRVLIQDFCHVINAGSSAASLSFYDQWTDYKYHTIAIDTEDPNPKLGEFFRWREGRCRDVIIAPSGTLMAD